MIKKIINKIIDANTNLSVFEEKVYANLVYEVSKNNWCKSFEDVSLSLNIEKKLKCNGYSIRTWWINSGETPCVEIKKSDLINNHINEYPKSHVSPNDNNTEPKNKSIFKIIK